jgi:hypothetical protein
MTKVCTKCGEEKDIKEFHKYSKSKDGLQYKCKLCKQEYYKKTSDHARKLRKERYLLTKEETLNKNKIYRENNKTKINTKKREYIKNRRHDDINYKLRMNIRTRLKNAIKNQSGEKAYKSIELLGCTIEECRAHLEAQFTEGMSWDLMGKYIHIDHIRPCASFDLTDPEQQKECFNYKNLQPLWAEDNLRKGDKYNEKRN